MLNIYNIINSKNKNQYTIINDSTAHIFIDTNDLSLARHYFHSIPKRKNGNILLIDNLTGEIIKMK